MTVFAGGPTFESGATYGGGSTYGGQAQSLAFVDETGINPLPAGILVTVTNASTGAPVGAAWTQPGGTVAIGVSAGTQYIAAFSLSAQAPEDPLEFTPDGNGATYVIAVSPYRSPSLSAVGYTQLEMAKLVRGWFGDTARAPGGVAYAIGFALAAGLFAFDGQTQANLGIQRLQGSQGADIDSWSLDMVGPMFVRYPAESDQLFIARNELMVARPRCTINAIQALVQAFYDSVIAGWQKTGNEALAFDEAGGMNISGAFDTAPTPQVPKNPPPVVVWDSMTAPDLAQKFLYLGQPVGPLEFVIQVGTLNDYLNQQLEYDTAGGFDTQGGLNINAQQGGAPTLTATPPDPRLGQIVNLIAKAAGTLPLYLIGSL
jgi:hypothetical protein